ncbi:acetyltransferase, GNAT family protein [Oceanicola granulosus HTCC2516]|uniref:Acetyltransferase, GNAT family protein n=1 Tax=Oceanicola granulosus (strain ATCC BAA-861 / DSM 15982 / KCTC 12143 / HTCC2516) TaxID=314256 RepID=Q2CCF5_OCEGH|nr:GNAT family N-acetyltransferase [Oceanicola granulosus]EAR50363.1 acetyltransferase, GNAT family protein [Oceanicola granulosus HTCC2516]
MRRARPGERVKIEAFLRRHLVRAMFPLANLVRHGMAGAHPRAMRFWLSETDGEVSDVLGMTEESAVLPILPSHRYAEAAATLAGAEVMAVIGPTEQAAGMRAALGLDNAPTMLASDEPHFDLALERLVVPEGPGRLRPLAEAPRDTFIEWMTDYNRTTLGMDREDARDEAEQRHVAYTESGSHVMLMDGDVPLAMTGFNATLPDIVQVGGVYTPPASRGRHHARRAVALHLAQARDRGASRATLFAANAPAVRAYTALGFEQIGHYTLCLFKGHQPVRPVG